MPRRDTLTRNKGGRPLTLTPEVEDRILEAVEKGNHITTACALAGASTTSLYRWLKRAEDYEYALEHGQPVNRAEVRFWEFRDRLLHARGIAAARMVGVIVSAAEGGRLIEEEPVMDSKGDPVRDADGNVMMRRKWTSPDGRLALQYLAKAQPDQWGQNPVTRLELVDGSGASARGDDGEPDGDAFSRMASRLSAIVERRALELGEGSGSTEEPEGDGEDVYEAEIVEEESDAE